MIVVLVWTKFQTGLPFPILSRPSTDMSYVDGWYFHSVMHYLNEIGGTISHVPTYTLPALWENNRSLMAAALHSGLFNTNQLKHINCVCMYLGNTYLSEICHPKGKTSSRDILHQHHSKHYQTQLTLPDQPRPNSQSWILWETLLSTFTKSDDITLLQPLGPWSPSHSKSGLWTTYRHANTIYHRTGP